MNHDVNIWHPGHLLLDLRDPNPPQGLKTTVALERVCDTTPED